jgi:hypothetical protein
MRLIKCATFDLEEFLGSNIPNYAILSHTWGDEEVLFAEFKSDLDSVRCKKGFYKIRLSCAQALRDGLDWIWVDTCCIDKSSSSELSEAINSMFQWYKHSSICYAYLSDVTLETFLVSFPQSRWYRRGWTLQELLAPKKLVFYDRDWHGLGTKQDHADWISGFTRIDAIALLGAMPHQNGKEADLGVFCVAKRMSWASDRETTRVEDTAYCLLGIFNINMPLLYGEGHRAFIRLQEEIIKNCDDESILAWGLDTEAKYDFDVAEQFLDAEYDGGSTRVETLASSPEHFKNCHGLKYAAKSPTPFLMTNLGLQIELPLVPVREHRHIQCWIGLLTCAGPSKEYLLGILLWPQEDTLGKVFRGQLGSSTNTVLVGARVAAEANLSKITILRNNESQSSRDYSYGIHQIMINQGKTLQKLERDGCNISAVFATDVLKKWSGHEIHSNISKWNPATKVLTVSNRYGDLITIGFELKSGYFCPFSVLICGIRAIIRKGLSFSDSEQREIFKLLSNENVQEDTEDPVLTGKDGMLYRVKVEMTGKIVCSWTIIEVNVDAVRIDEGKNINTVSIDESQAVSVKNCADLSSRISYVQFREC